MNRITSCFEHIFVILPKAIDKPEILNSGLLLYLSNCRLLEFLFSLNPAFWELPVPRATFQEKILPLPAGVTEEDCPSAYRFHRH